MVFAFGAPACWACHSPPREQTIGVDEQIWLASDVSVAKVVNASVTADGQTEYEFLVYRRIAGEDRQRFTVIGSGKLANHNQSDFAKHTDDAFWRAGGGRLFNDTDCVIHPTFVLGASYLAFLGQPITRRSFERIGTSSDHIDSSDKWLSYIEAKMRGTPR